MRRETQNSSDTIDVDTLSDICVASNPRAINTGIRPGHYIGDIRSNEFARQFASAPNVFLGVLWKTQQVKLMRHGSVGGLQAKKFNNFAPNQDLTRDSYVMLGENGEWHTSAGTEGANSTSMLCVDLWM